MRRAEHAATQLQGITDLSVQAVVKRGLVPCFETWTYGARLRRVLRTLDAGRRAARENPVAFLPRDVIRGLQTVKSIRFAVLGPRETGSADERLLLNVTFDRGWESYLRAIHRDLGTLLDLLYCHCEGYPISTESSFERYADWVRASEIPGDFFYAHADATVADEQWQKALERSVREGRGPRPCELAVDGEGRPLPVVAPPAAAVEAAVRASMPRLLSSLASLAALRPMFPPSTAADAGSGDAGVLRRAVADLLSDFARLMPAPAAAAAVAAPAAAPAPGSLPALMGLAMRQQPSALAWLAAGIAERRAAAAALEAAVEAARSRGRQGIALEDVQGGVLDAYGSEVSHGALALLRVVDPAAARASLAQVLPEVTTAAQGQPVAGDAWPRINLAFTHAGLRAFGVVPERQLEDVPPPFHEGMERRAGPLGDHRSAHPDRWVNPPRNWGAGAGGQPVPMAQVHVVVQWRVAASEAERTDATADPLAPLLAAWLGPEGAVSPAAPAPKLAGFEVLHVKRMRRNFVAAPATGPTVGHFRFVDGSSQPQVGAPGATAGAAWDDRVAAGEILLGHATDREGVPVPEAGLGALDLLADGSFLVVRVLRQHVSRWDAMLAREAARLAAEHRDPTITPAWLADKLMGRRADGAALATMPPGATGDNDFDYRDDVHGATCPRVSHVRRANPREPLGPPLGGAPAPVGHAPRIPRLARRGMSYGPPTPAVGAADDGADRGLVFMAYCADIAEQFEVVQRWLAGGNASGLPSVQRDPVCGVPEPGDERVVGFPHDVRREGGRLERVELRVRLDAEDAPARPGSGPAFAALQWGLYAFAPSIPVLRRLATGWAPVGGTGAAGAGATGAGTPPAGPTLPRRRGAEALALLRRLDPVAAAPAPVTAAAMAPPPAPDAPPPQQGPEHRWKAALEIPDATRDLWGAVVQAEHEAVKTSLGFLAGHPADVQAVFEGSGEGGPYSVAGYEERLAGSVGHGYLGVDYEGTPEQPLANAVNAALASIDEARAYDEASRHAGEWLAAQRALIGAAGLQAAPIELRTLTEHVLGRLTRAWFGLPAAVAAVAADGGAAGADGFADAGPGDPLAGAAARCPGDFYAPSRHVFSVLPTHAASADGQRDGMRARQAMQVAVQAAREGGVTLPELAGRIDTAVRTHGAAKPSATRTGRDDEAVAATIVGSAMGFVPTTDGNLRTVLAAWLADGTFQRLQRPPTAGAAPPALDAAKAWLEPELMRQMMVSPVPDTLWRTVREPGKGRARCPLHDPALGAAGGGGGGATRAGDRVVIGIGSATRALLAAEGAAALAKHPLVFGGAYGEPGAPLHACPGRAMAMGTMLGVLAVLLAAPVERLPAPTQLLLRA
jgi:hypothetical protein